MGTPRHIPGLAEDPKYVDFWNSIKVLFREIDMPVSGLPANAIDLSAVEEPSPGMKAWIDREGRIWSKRARGEVVQVTPDWYQDLIARRRLVPSRRSILCHLVVLAINRTIEKRLETHHTRVSALEGLQRKLLERLV